MIYVSDWFDACMVEGETYFVGKDVADALGYVNPTKAVSVHVDEEDRSMSEMDTHQRGKREMSIINKSGLYALILSSFQRTADALVHLAQGELPRGEYESLKGWLRSG